MEENENKLSMKPEINLRLPTKSLFGWPEER